MTTATKTRVSRDGRTATVSIQVTFRQHGGRKQILTPQGATPWSAAPRVDTALVKVIVRAHRWRQMLESGEYVSSAELAKVEKVNASYLRRYPALFGPRSVALIASDFLTWGPTAINLVGCRPGPEANMGDSRLLTRN